MTLTQGTLDRLGYGLGPYGKQAADEINQLLGYVAGTTYYVDSTNSAASDTAARLGTSRDEPFATLDYAIGRCTASKGDTIVLMPGHAETTTAIALDVAGVRIVGLGYGRNRPTLTATTAASDLINVTAANCQLHNVRLVGAASGNTSLLDTSAAGTDFEMYDVELVAAATPLQLLQLGGARPVIKRLRVHQSADGVDYVVMFTAGVDGALFDEWEVLCPSGIDNGLIGSGAFAHDGCIFFPTSLTVVGIDTLLVNFVSSTAGAPDSFFVRGNVMASAALTSIEDMVAAATSKGLAFGRVYANDATGKAGGLIPLTTAS